VVLLLNAFVGTLPIREELLDLWRQKYLQPQPDPGTNGVAEFYARLLDLRSLVIGIVILADFQLKIF
jgi:hypothetical protein